MTEIDINKKENERKRNRIILMIIYPVIIAVGIYFALNKFVLTGKETRTLYFYHIRKHALATEKQGIPHTKELNEKIKATLDALRDGPNDIELARLIPYEATIHSVFVKDDIAIVDLDEEFFLNIEEGKEKMVIESITKTIFSNFRKIKKVSIIINGKQLNKLAKDIYIDKPFER